MMFLGRTSSHSQTVFFYIFAKLRAITLVALSTLWVQMQKYFVYMFTCLQCEVGVGFGGERTAIFQKKKEWIWNNKYLGQYLFGYS